MSTMASPFTSSRQSADTAGQYCKGTSGSERAVRRPALSSRGDDASQLSRSSRHGQAGSHSPPSPVAYQHFLDVTGDEAQHVAVELDDR